MVTLHIASAALATSLLSLPFLPQDPDSPQPKADPCQCEVIARWRDATRPATGREYLPSGSEDPFNVSEVLRTSGPQRRPGHCDTNECRLAWPCILPPITLEVWTTAGFETLHVIHVQPDGSRGPAADGALLQGGLANGIAYTFEPPVDDKVAYTAPCGTETAVHRLEFRDARGELRFEIEVEFGCLKCEESV